MFCCVYIYIHLFICVSIYTYIYILRSIFIFIFILILMCISILNMTSFILFTPTPGSSISELHLESVSIEHVKGITVLHETHFLTKNARKWIQREKYTNRYHLYLYIYIYVYIRVSKKWLFWGQYGVLFWEQLLGYLFKDTQIFPLMNVFWCGENRSLNLSWTKDRCFAASMWNTSHGKVPYMQRKKRSSLGILMPLKTIWANFVPKSSYSWKRFGHFGGKKTPIPTSVRLFENHTPCFWNCIDLPSSGQNGQKNISMGYRFLGGSSDLVGSQQRWWS